MATHINDSTSGCLKAWLEVLLIIVATVAMMIWLYRKLDANPASKNSTTICAENNCTIHIWEKS